MSRIRVGVVGGGISGLMSAYVLAKAGVEVVLYEKENHLGSHAKIVTFDGVDLDLGLMVFNRVTCPNMTEFFESSGVDMEISDMSFSVSLDEGNGYEWGSRNGLSSMFSQKVNSLNPYFLKMLCELRNFKHHVLRYFVELEHNQIVGRDETMGDFIKSHGYSELFQKAFIVPISSSLCPCPIEELMRMSAVLVLSYFRDHHLFPLFNVPQWLTVKHASETYIKKVREDLESRGCQIRTKYVVQCVSKLDDGCLVICEDGSKEKYNGCIIDVDASETLRLLGEQATDEEKGILETFNYVYSDNFLHRDKNLMPRNQGAWSALNFAGNKDNKSCLTYWLNVYQHINDNGLPFLVTINPYKPPKSTLLKWTTRQLVPSVAASKASVELRRIQGKRGIWFCGSYQGYGFHENRLKEGMLAANGILDKSCEVLNNPKPMVFSLIKACARSFVVRFLKDFIALGTLTLVEEGGTMLTFEGTKNKSPLKVHLKVHNPQFYWKIVTQADLGLADAYINGDFSLVDKTRGLLDMLTIFCFNNDFKYNAPMSNKRGWWTPKFSTAMVASAKYFYDHVSRQNSVTQARRNISRHYDLSNELFSLFLDETMTYSCAIFKTEDENLKAAQMRKTCVIIQKAIVGKNHEVLEIGFGWGTLGIEIVKQTGCKYTGITLSKEQLVYAEEKVKEAGLQENIRLLLCDYREIPEKYKYDRIISIGMIEHVGHEYYEDFFGCCESLLVEDGLLILQFISIPDGRYDEVRQSPGFIREYIFPGGCIPSLNRLTLAMKLSSRLCVEHVENIGPHYYQTLRHWRTNWIKNQSKILALGFNQEFIRTWEYYFDCCAAGFRTRALGDYQVVFSRPGNNATLGDPDKGVVLRPYSSSD